MYLQLPYVADNTFFMVSSCINDGYAHEKHISISKQYWKLHISTLTHVSTAHKT